MTIEFALTPDTRRGTGLVELVAAVGDAGFTALGMHAWHSDAAAARVLAEGGLRCHEVSALVLGSDDEAVLAQARRLSDAAAAVRAPWILTTFAAPLDAVTRPLIARCAAIFAEGGARMAVEFSPLGAVTSLSAAREVVSAAGGPGRAGVLIDVWHFFRGDSTWDDLERVPLDAIAYVQFDDAPPPISDDAMHETMYRRVMPGDGEFALDRFASTLRGRGWSGVVSVEVLSEELREIPLREFTATAYESTVRYWR